MEFDPAIVLLGAVVVLLVAIFIGVLCATRDRRTQVGAEAFDELHRRLEAIAPEIEVLAAQIRHLEEVEGLQREITHLREENQRLQHEWRKLLDEVAHVLLDLRDGGAFRALSWLRSSRSKPRRGGLRRERGDAPRVARNGVQLKLVRKRAQRAAPLQRTVRCVSWVWTKKAR